jgi:predicted transcriptional regulator
MINNIKPARVYKQKRTPLVLDFWADILLSIDAKHGSTLTDLTNKTHITYSHICSVRNTLVDTGFVTLCRKGRTMVITLTQKGKEIVKLLDEVKRLLK